MASSMTVLVVNVNVDNAGQLLIVGIVGFCQFPHLTCCPVTGLIEGRVFNQLLVCGINAGL